MRKAIFTCANRTWLNQARVTVSTIIRHNPGIDVYLFTNGFTGLVTADISIDGCNIVEVEKYVSRKHMETGETFPIPEDSMNMRFSGISYLKSNGYDVAVYMDADAIMLKPFPADFWVQKNGMVEDNLGKELNGRPSRYGLMQYGYGRKEAIDNGSRYFNSGFMRLNLHDDRLDDIFDKYENFINDGSIKSNLVDQAFLNTLIGDDYEQLSYGYNFHCWQSGYLKNHFIYDEKSAFKENEFPSVLTGLLPQIYVIHYAAQFKPWTSGYIPNARGKSMFLYPYIEAAKLVDGLSDKFKSKLDKNEKFFDEHVICDLEVKVPILPIKSTLIGGPLDC